MAQKSNIDELTSTFPLYCLGSFKTTLRWQKVPQDWLEMFCERGKYILSTGKNLDIHVTVTLKVPHILKIVAD